MFPRLKRGWSVYQKWVWNNQWSEWKDLLSLKENHETQSTVIPLSKCFSMELGLEQSIHCLLKVANIWSVLLFQIFSEKLHKGKVTHAEFNPRCDWLLATASVDRTVKLWDLRNMKDRKSFLYEMPHERPVNSGCILREKDVCMAPYCSPAMLGWGWEGL